jgi:formylglycine-generating enzyme required for sulfatase activity
VLFDNGAYRKAVAELERARPFLELPGSWCDGARAAVRLRQDVAAAAAKARSAERIGRLRADCEAAAGEWKKGDAALQAGNPEQACGLYRAASRQYRQLADKVEGPGDGLLAECEKDVEEGRFDEAIAGLTELLALRPGNPRVTSLLHQARVGRLLAEAEANDSEANGKVALAVLGELLKLDPDNARALALQAKIRGYYRPQPLDGTGRDGVSAAAVRRAQEVWAKHLGCKVEQTTAVAGRVEMTFVLIPPGTFRMGSPDGEPGRLAHEGPQHVVEIAQPFYLGKYEVTRGQFRQFVEETGSKAKDWHGPGFEQTDEHPVVHMSWDDAKAFCAWLSRKEGKKYRLPTEAEWEYSCRAGAATKFSFGDGEADLGDHAWYAENTGKKGTQPCGRKKPNALGRTAWSAVAASATRRASAAVPAAAGTRPRTAASIWAFALCSCGRSSAKSPTENLFLKGRAGAVRPLLSAANRGLTVPERASGGRQAPVARGKQGADAPRSPLTGRAGAVRPLLSAANRGLTPPARR